MSQAQLAESLGVSQQAVSAWIKGTAAPKSTHAARIEELLGIPMRAWTEDVGEDEDDPSEMTGTEG